MKKDLLSLKDLTEKEQNGWYTGVVHIWDLPEELVFIDLEQNFKKEFLKSLKGNLSWEKLASYSRISHKKLEHFIEGHRTSLGVIWKLLEFSKNNENKITKEDIEKNVIRIGGHQSEIKDPKLPFNFNSLDGAKIIAACLHDGGIRNKSFLFFYTNENSKKRKEIFNSVKNVFGENITDNTDSEIVEFFNIVGIVLVFGIGLETGQKVINNPHIPQFISKNKKIIPFYLGQAFDDDGYVCKGKNKFIGITSNTANEKNPPISNLLLDIKNLLELIDIQSQNVVKSKVRPKFFHDNIYISQEWKLSIKNIYSLIKFKENINFGIDYKKQDLNEIIEKLKSSLKFFNKPRGLSEREAFQISKTICKNNRYIDKNILASEMGFSAYWTKDLLKRLEEKELLQRLPDRKYKESSKFVIKVK